MPSPDKSSIPPCPICGGRMYQPEGDTRLFCERTQWPVLTATRAWNAAKSREDRPS